MGQVRKSEFERMIAAEFQRLHGELTRYFGETLDHLIANVIKSMVMTRHWSSVASHVRMRRTHVFRSE